MIEVLDLFWVDQMTEEPTDEAVMGYLFFSPKKPRGMEYQGSQSQISSISTGSIMSIDSKERS